MISFECDFFPACSQADMDGYVDSVLSSFLAALYRDGFILDRVWNLVHVENRLRLFCIAPTEDAFGSALSSPQMRADLQRLLDKSSRPPAIRPVGKLLGLPDCCSCGDPSWYLLFTNFLDDGPPVRCGDCGQGVPLYRLPLLDGEVEHNSIREWAAAYQAYDTLFMLSGSGEELGYRQMADLDGATTREGRDVCERMAARMGRPWYYYLHRYGEPQSEECPGCGGPWERGEPLPRPLDYRCDRCCLVSSEPGG